ncbi:MAG: GDP-mannose 4,6-dehydratase [Deltaproteobacteria bacterium]|nr:GDP-mannose 4,6-dehydratase [Deltaproteobacteria bacterium]
MIEKYLVTGGMGFIGSHWCEFLLEKGKTVYGLDLGPYYPKLFEYDKFFFIQDTIKNYGILKRAVDRVDCVCHFAGIAEPGQYVAFPRKVIDITAVVGIKLIEMCRLTGKLFFFTSTSEIYGKSSKVPFKEEDDRVLGATFTKRWCYSTSKAVLEHYLDACACAKELSYITARLFNVYGPRLQGRVVSKFLDSFLSNEDIIIHGDGSQTRSFTYIDDIMEGFDLLINNPKCYNEVFNIGSERETSINELAAMMKEIGKFNSQIRYMPHRKYYGESFEDVSRRVPDISKIKQYTGWSPKTTLEEGLDKMIRYAKNEKNKGKMFSPGK